jgi:hypothetical protein
MISTNSKIATATKNLQVHLNRLQYWFSLWKIKMNESKSTHITFTLRPKTIPHVYINNQIIPMEKSVKYIVLTLDQRLTWADHIKAKRTLLNLRFHKLRPFLRSKTSLINKILIYKQILRPAMTYGIQHVGYLEKLKPNQISSIPLNNSPCPLQCSLVHQQPHPTPRPQLTTNILTCLS